MQSNLDIAGEELQKAVDENEEDIEAKAAALKEALESAKVIMSNEVTLLKSKDTQLENRISTFEINLDVALSKIEKDYQAADAIINQGVDALIDMVDSLEKENSELGNMLKEVQKINKIYLLVLITLGVLGILGTVAFGNMLYKKSRKTSVVEKEKETVNM